MRKNSIKNTRVNAEVQRELSNILRGGIKDPRVSPMTSVVAVEVAPDLSSAKVYVSKMGADDATEQAVKALNRAAGHVRSEVAAHMHIRKAPEFRFFADDGAKYATHINELIAGLKREE